MVADCLLCLEKTDPIDSIKVDSIQWLTENIKHLIEKHLWPMETIEANAYLCGRCWQELKNFHRFYEQVEEAHAKLSSISKTQDQANLHYNLHQIVFSNFNANDDGGHIEPEVLMEQPILHEFVTRGENVCIKKEKHDLCSDNKFREQNEVDFKSDKIIEDPLNKNKKSKKIFKKTETKSKSMETNSENFRKTTNSMREVKDESVKSRTENLDRRDATDSDVYFENPTDTEPLINCNKKRKNPDEKTGQEYDKFISENFQIVCSICQIFLKDFILLRKHFREEHKKRGFVICCKKKIFSRPLLVDHIRIHLDPNYFKCKECQKVYSERSTFESHMKIHESGQKDRNHTCEICGKSFVGAIQLENHKLTHAPDYEKKFSCSECGKFFTTSYSLNYHIQAIHHNKFVNICDICGKTMRCRNQFKLHREKHDGEQTTAINCDICGLRLTDRRGLRRHKNSQHPVGGKKEYHCHLCLKVSPNQEALRTHIRLTHGTNYNHKCTMCDKAFKRPYALREHMATHTGTALYACPWCPKTFISNGNMHNHRKKLHPKEWEEAHRKKFSGNLRNVQ